MNTTSILFVVLLIACGLTERKLGAAERKFHKEALANFVSPLKNYLNTEMAAMQREKRILDTKRLDLDVAKNRVRKCTKPAELPVSIITSRHTTTNHLTNSKCSSCGNLISNLRGT